MIVYFLRHASAGDSLSNPTRDARRALDEEGIEQSGLAGRALNSVGVQVDAVVSSPLKRATQTASLVANELGFDGKITYSTVLSEATDFAQFRLLLSQHNKREAIMLVGHNPSLSQFLSLLLSGGKTDRAVELKKGAVARVDIDSRNRAVLQWCLTPKLLRSLYDSVATNSRPKTV